MLCKNCNHRLNRKNLHSNVHKVADTICKVKVRYRIYCKCLKPESD